MRKFVKLEPGFWTGKTGRDLRKAGQDAQLLALYLLSSPHANFINLYYLPLSYVTADTGMSADQVAEAMRKVVATGFAQYDEGSECVWLIEGARRQIGEKLSSGDKVVVKVQDEFDSLPSDCVLRAPFLEMYAEAYHLKAPRKAPAVVSEKAAVAEPAQAKAPAKAPAAASKDSAKLREMLKMVDGQRRQMYCLESGDAAVHDRARALVARFGEAKALEMIFNAIGRMGDWELVFDGDVQGAYDELFGKKVAEEI